jgi:hypothetical protein
MKFRNGTKGYPKVLPLFNTYDLLDGLERDLIQALYQQRSLEYQILRYAPETSAPCELKEEFCNARVKVNDIERKIRMLKHNF